LAQLGPARRQPARGSGLVPLGRGADHRVQQAARAEGGEPAPAPAGDARGRAPGPEFEVELIEADAELPDAPAAELIPNGFAAKYRELLRRAGLTLHRYAEVYSQPIVLRPTRFLGYGGHGWKVREQQGVAT
jgi:hypothetical protein